MAQYGLIKAGPRPVWRVLDQHNATFQILERMARGGAWWKRLLLNREARAFARYEAAVCQRYDRVTFVTDTDRTAMVRLVKDGTFPDRTSVIPICVDTDSVPALAPVERPFRVTHVGTMYWPPNVDGLSWFWQSVWPRVLAEAPEARLTLIGKRPPDHIRQWDRAPDVDVLGYVEDLDPYLRQTAVFVVPLHAAGGMRVKIVDAWCWGLPIVATTIGAEGIAVRDGENILIADDPGAFARAIVRVMAEPVLQQSLRTAGRAWVEQQYDWRQRYVGFDRVYGDLLNRTAAEVRS